MENSSLEETIKQMQLATAELQAKTEQTKTNVLKLKQNK